MQHYIKLKFILVGLLNTAIDFGIFNVLLLVFHMQPVVASIISTTVAMLISFLLNRSFVFNRGGHFNGREALQFFAVTIVGLWVVQSLVISQVGGFVHAMLFTSQVWASDDIAKVIAIGASTVWNYLWYSRLVFATKEKARA
jgi:putative flippase GtrA